MEKIFNFFVTEKNKKSQIIFIIAIYMLAIVLLNIRIIHYQKTAESFPDEESHVAYIAYLVKTKKIIPEFKEMQELENNIYEENNRFKENTVNHLGHPPIYYHMMKSFNLVKVNGDSVIYDLTKLRLVSQIITNIAIMIAFYIGYKNIKSVMGNVFFAMFFVSIPLLPYISGAVQNDVLSFLGVNIYVLGMLRFVDKKRDYLTYFLIAVAVLICMLNKLTVGLIVGISYIIIMIYTIINEKSIKSIFNKKILVTLPIYLIILVYYLIIINRYGTVNPSLLHIAPDYLKTTMWYNNKIYKNAYTFYSYAPIWWINFKTYWAGINESTHTLNKSLVCSNYAIIIFIFPIVYYIIQKIKKEKINITYYSIFLAVIIVITLQLFNAWHEFINYTGYWGKYQGRYYVCAMLPFAFAFAKIIEEIINKSKSKTLKILTTLIAIGYILVLY